MLTPDKELKRVSGSQVLGCVELISVSFADASELIVKLRKAQKKRKGERDFYDTLLSKLFEQGGQQVRDAYDRGYSRFGGLFRIGDDQARGQILSVAIDITAYVLTPLRAILADDKADISLLQVQEVAITGRHDAVRSLNSLFHRLQGLQSADTPFRFCVDSSVCGDDIDVKANRRRSGAPDPSPRTPQLPPKSGLRRILSSANKGESNHRWDGSGGSHSLGSHSQESAVDTFGSPLPTISPLPPLSVKDLAFDPSRNASLKARSDSYMAQPPPSSAPVKQAVPFPDITTQAHQASQRGDLASLPLTNVWESYSMRSRYLSAGHELRLQTSPSSISPLRPRPPHPFTRRSADHEPLKAPRPAPPIPTTKRLSHHATPLVQTGEASTGVIVAPPTTPMVPSPLRLAVTARASPLTQDAVQQRKVSTGRQDYDKDSIYSHDDDTVESERADRLLFIGDNISEREPVSPISSGASSPCRTLDRRSISPVSPTTDYSPSLAGGHGRESVAYSYTPTPKDTGAPSMCSSQGANISYSRVSVQDIVSVQRSVDMIYPEKTATYEAWKAELQTRLKEDKGGDARKQVKEEAKMKAKALKAEEKVKLQILKEEERQMLHNEKERARTQKEKAKKQQKNEKQKVEKSKDAVKRMEKAKKIMNAPVGGIGTFAAISGPPPASTSRPLKAMPATIEDGTPSTRPSNIAKLLVTTLPAADTSNPRSSFKRPETAMSTISAWSKESGNTATTTWSSAGSTRMRVAMFGGKSKSKEEIKADKAAALEARRARAKYMAERYGTAYLMAGGAGGGGC